MSDEHSVEPDDAALEAALTANTEATRRSDDLADASRDRFGPLLRACIWLSTWGVAPVVVCLLVGGLLPGGIYPAFLLSIWAAPLGLGLGVLFALRRKTLDR